MSYKTALSAVFSASLLASNAASAADLPAGRWYKVDEYRCRAFRDFVDHRPSVIGTHRNISQRACSTLCNGTPNCAAYNYIVRLDRARGLARPAHECQLLNSADQPVATFQGAPGEAAYVCYKGFPAEYETPDLEADARRSFQDSLRPSTPPPPPAPPRND
jgi:hypothetical protein